jgi:hypothetical protein
LKELKSRGYRIVHIEPATADRPKTATLPSQWVMNGASGGRRPHWPRPVLRIEMLLAEASLPAASPASFGLEAPAAQTVALSPAPQRAGKPRPLPAPLWPQSVNESLRLSDAKAVLPPPGPQEFGYSSGFAPIVPQDGETLVLRGSLAAPPIEHRAAARRAAKPTPVEPVGAPSDDPRPIPPPARADSAAEKRPGQWPVTAAGLRKGVVR